MPTLTQGAAVPSLYSHITHFDNKEETDIPQPFKGVKPKQTKNRGGGKGKQQQQKPKPPPVQIQEEQYTYEDTNNYYHNTSVNTKVTIIKAITTKVHVVNTTTHIEAIIRVIIMANLEAEAMVMVELITMDVVTAGLIIEVITTTNTISIIIMIMTTSLSNMAHHVHYVVATITFQNIVLKENMTLTT